MGVPDPFLSGTVLVLQYHGTRVLKFSGLAIPHGLTPGLALYVTGWSLSTSDFLSTDLNKSRELFSDHDRKEACEC